MPKITGRTIEEHRAETIDRLLDAWSELVLSKGYADVSLADVAARAGLARTAIYNYFPDRETLLFTWTDREVRRSLAILERELSETDLSAEQLRIFVRLQLVDFTRRHLPPGHEVVQFLRPETYEQFMRHIEPVETIARRIVEEGVASGEFDNVDPSAVVPLILACIGSERGPLSMGVHDIDEASDRVTDFLLRALGAAPKQPPKKTARKRPSRAS